MIQNIKKQMMNIIICIKSGRRKEVSAIRYKNKREQIIEKCIEYNSRKYKEDPNLDWFILCDVELEKY